MVSCCAGCCTHPDAVKTLTMFSATPIRFLTPRNREPETYDPFLAVAISLGVPPVLAALVLGFFSSLFASLTHYGTAPAPILFGSGHVPLATWWKTGFVVSAVNIAIWLSVGAAWWRVLGLW